MSSGITLSGGLTAQSFNSDTSNDAKAGARDSGNDEVSSLLGPAKKSKISPAASLQGAFRVSSATTPTNQQTRSFEESLRDWVQAKNISLEESKERQAIQELILKAQQTQSELDLRDRKFLTSLPEGLNIKSNLVLSGCAALMSLPQGLSIIGGALYLDYCICLTSLPDRLQVGDNLDLYGCTGLVSLPEGLSVGRNFYLTNCTGLTSLPEELSVGGNLDLRNCTGLISLPKELNVSGDLVLKGCRGIDSLPQRILTWSAKENGEKHQVFLQGSGISSDMIEHMQKVTQASIQFHFSAAKSKSVHDDSKSTEVFEANNDDIAAKSSINLETSNPTISLQSAFSPALSTSQTGQKKPSFEANLRDWVQAKDISRQESEERQRVQGDILISQQTGGSLLLANCTSLTGLPNGLISIDGDLVLDGCTGLICLPKGLVVKGDLGLYGCTSLTGLPEGVFVGGNLFMNSCKNLRELPKGLRVGGYLGLYGCVSLISLPEGLSVGGNLGLGDCIGLMSLPEELSVGDNLDLRGCLGITSLPPSILAWSAKKNGEKHQIYLELSGISEKTMERIEKANPAGTQFHFSRTEEPATQKDFEDLPDAVIFWRTENGDKDIATPNFNAWQLSQHTKMNLNQYLSRLRNTADFKNEKSRHHLTQRVAIFLDHLEQEELRSFLLGIIDKADATCSDGNTVMMDNLEIAILVHQAKDDERNLRKLGLSLMRLNVLRQCAAKKVESLVAVDETEVYLAYETRLRKRLQLPTSTEGMLFEQLSKVTEEDIEDAYNKVIAQIQDQGALDAYLKTFEPLQQLLREQLRRQEIAKLPYEMIHQYIEVSPKQLEQSRCLTTLESAKQPVWVQFDNTWHVYEYQSLCKHWIEHGTAPLENTSRQVTLQDWFRPYCETSSMSEKWAQLNYKIKLLEPKGLNVEILSQATRLAFLNVCYDECIKYADCLIKKINNQESAVYIEALQFKALSLYLQNQEESTIELRLILNNWPQVDVESNAYAKLLSLLIDEKLDAKYLINDQEQFLRIVNNPNSKDYFFKLTHADVYVASLDFKEAHGKKVRNFVGTILTEAKNLANQCREGIDNKLIESHENRINSHMEISEILSYKPKYRIQVIWEEYINSLQKLDFSNEETISKAWDCLQTLRVIDDESYIAMHELVRVGYFAKKHLKAIKSADRLIDNPSILTSEKSSLEDDEREKLLVQTKKYKELLTKVEEHKMEAQQFKENRAQPAEFEPEYNQYMIDLCTKMVKKRFDN